LKGTYISKQSVGPVSVSYTKTKCYGYCTNPRGQFGRNPFRFT